MFKTYKLWGEIAENPIEHKRCDYGEIIERAKDHNSLKNYLKILPEEPKTNTDEEDNKIRIRGVDRRILHTIALHDHRNTIQDLIDMKMRRTGSKSSKRPPPTPSYPRLHRRRRKVLKRNLKNIFGHYPEPKTIPFLCNAETNTQDIGRNVRHKILRQCVAALFAHIGFEYTSESILDTLVAICDEFFTQICKQLRTITDMSDMGLIDTESKNLELVFMDMGLGSLKSLQKYYKSRVIKYEKRMYQQSEETLNLLNDLEGPYPKSDETDCDIDNIDIGDISINDIKEIKPRIHILDFFRDASDDNEQEDNKKDIPVIHLSEEAGSDFIELLDDLEQKTEETLKDAERMLCRSLFNRICEAGGDCIERLDDLEQKTEETLKDVERTLCKSLFNKIS